MQKFLTTKTDFTALLEAVKLTMIMLKKRVG